MRIISFPAVHKVPNPYLSLLYSEIQNIENGECIYPFSFKNILRRTYNIVHVHWPESRGINKGFVKAFMYFIGFNLSILFLKIRGAKVVWTVHNLSPHEKRWPLLQKLHFFIFSHLVDGFIVMNGFTKDIIEQLYPVLKKRKHAYIRHGHYKGYYENNNNQLTARAKLHIKENAILGLFFGSIREYKGIDRLIKVFQELNCESFHLIIAGAISKENKEYGEKLRNQITSSNINLIIQFVPDNEVQIYLNAADLVILPFKDILNSGSTLLALSFNKPVLLPSTATNREIADEYENGWINTFDVFDKKVLKDTMLESVKKRNQVLDMSNRDWKLLAQQTTDFYEEVLK
jgi:beta-1,4-mannosyltransferase